MNSFKRTLALVQVLLVFPATLFMTALFVRSAQPEQYEPAQTARRVVDWFAARPRLGLDILLITLPFAALVIGSTTLLRSWRNDAEFRRTALDTLAVVRRHLATLFIAGATVTAAGILAVVALHMITD